MRVFVWLLRAFLFFSLFAFALNNRHEIVVQWFFGADWHAPLVIVVLAAFGLGCAVGILAMVPGRWKRRRAAAQAPEPPNSPAPSMLTVTPSEFGPAQHPPREGL